MWEGTVVSIHIAPEASAPMQSITEARAFPGRGLEGDRYFAGTGLKKSSYGGREVTLIEIEAVGALFGGVLNAEGERFSIKLAAADTRRNIATSRVPLIILSTVNSGSAPCDENLVTVLSEHSGPASECGAGISVVLAGQRDRKQRIKQIVARERNGRTDTSPWREGYGVRWYIAENCATREELNSPVAISPQTAANESHSPGIARLPVAWMR